MLESYPPGNLCCGGGGLIRLPSLQVHWLYLTKVPCSDSVVIRQYSQCDWGVSVALPVGRE